MSPPNPLSVKHISECFIKPKHTPEEAKHPIHLSPWDLAMLSVQYIQKGLLFNKKPHKSEIVGYLDKLRDTLSLTLDHFYPLAGRLSTMKKDDPPCYYVFIDCVNSPGAKFILATVDMTVSDVLSPTDVPLIVQSFFDHDRAINHDGHTKSLLSIQVTELVDGIFIGCSINHMIVDGTSYWNFFNAWSDIFKAGNKEPIPISCLPIHKRWMPNGYDKMKLPFTSHDEFISRHEAPPLRERIFHFSAKSLAKLKSKANTEAESNKISTLQALSALMWRCITRVRNQPLNEETGCKLAVNNRLRLHPKLPDEYFGNSIQTVKSVVLTKDLLDNGIGWAAWRLHEAVANHTNEAVVQWVEWWLKSHFIYQLGQFFDPKSIMMGSSPRFDMYGNEFGLGRAVAVRSGYAHKFDGMVTLYPGNEGGGEMDLEICLSPSNMTALENDEEFMAALS